MPGPQSPVLSNGDRGFGLAAAVAAVVVGGGWAWAVASFAVLLDPSSVAAPAWRWGRVPFLVLVGIAAVSCVAGGLLAMVRLRSGRLSAWRPLAVAAAASGVACLTGVSGFALQWGWAAGNWNATTAFAGEGPMGDFFVFLLVLKYTGAGMGVLLAILLHPLRRAERAAVESLGR